MTTTIKTGPCWRIAPSGTTEVWLISIKGTRACVHSHGQIGNWAKRAMYVETADLFDTRAEARAEYRLRRAATDQAAGLNLTTDRSDTHA